MGYHETYEFFAIDRPLGTSEMKALRGGVRPPARCASLVSRGGVTVLTLGPPEDAGEFGLPCGTSGEEELYDETSWAVPLALLRPDLLAGDLRGLYLLWLASVQGGERRLAQREPPWPAGLDGLTGTLHLLAEFLRLDAGLLAVALGRPPTRPRSAGSLVAAARRRAEEGDVLG